MVVKSTMHLAFICRLPLFCWCAAFRRKWRLPQTKQKQANEVEDDFLRVLPLTWRGNSDRKTQVEFSLKKRKAWFLSFLSFHNALARWKNHPSYPSLLREVLCISCSTNLNELKNWNQTKCASQSYDELAGVSAGRFVRERMLYLFNALQDTYLLNISSFN